MDAIKAIERKISMSEESTSTNGSNENLQPTIRFHPAVQVAMLPWQESVEARKARAGLWKPAPLSDELWDGDFMTFREFELTADEFRRLTNAQKKKTGTAPMLRPFARMFSIATVNSESSSEHRLAGVDLVHARARVYAEDFDEEDRDSNGRLESSESEDAHIVLKLSAATIGDEVVLAFVEDPHSPKAPPPPKSIVKRPSGDKLTRFIPSPPPGPSPRERASALGQTDRPSNLSQPSDFPIKKTSTMEIMFTTGQQFYCGDGKRPLFYMGYFPLRDEPTFQPPTPDPAPVTTKVTRKRSVFSAVLATLFPVASN